MAADFLHLMRKAPSTRPSWAGTITTWTPPLLAFIAVTPLLSCHAQGGGARTPAAPGRATTAAVSCAGPAARQGLRLEVPAGELVHDVAGAGRPVVFIHGGLVDRRVWERQ